MPAKRPFGAFFAKKMGSDNWVHFFDEAIMLQPPAGSVYAAVYYRLANFL